MKEHSKTAWDIAIKYGAMLGSETRDLAAHIDVAIAAKDAEIERMTAERDQWMCNSRENKLIAEQLDKRTQDEIKRLRSALEIACRRGCDHCADDIRQARSAVNQ